jgi:hypothetical protein
MECLPWLGTSGISATLATLMDFAQTPKVNWLFGKGARDVLSRDRDSRLL